MGRAAILYIEPALIGKLIGEGSLGVPIDKISLSGGIGQQIPLMKTGKTDIGTGIKTKFLFDQHIGQAALLGKYIELIVVAVQGVQHGVFAIAGFIKGSSVRGAVIDRQAIIRAEKGSL